MLFMFLPSLGTYYNVINENYNKFIEVLLKHSINQIHEGHRSIH